MLLRRVLKNTLNLVMITAATDPSRPEEDDIIDESSLFCEEEEEGLRRRGPSANVLIVSLVKTHRNHEQVRLYGENNSGSLVEAGEPETEFWDMLTVFEFQDIESFCSFRKEQPPDVSGGGKFESSVSFIAWHAAATTRLS